MKRIIADHGKSFYHIVTEKMPHEAELYAASVLYQYLYKATNAIVPFFSDVERCPRKTPEIHVGANVRGKKTDISHLSDDGFLLRTSGEDIIITGKTPRGTVYGVYYFLEKYIGFKCFTKDTETFNTVETLIVEDLDISENPAFEYREIYFRSAFDTDFCVKNRLNSNMAHIPKEKGGKLKFYNFHHSFLDLVPPEIHYETHPEYYSLVNGVRLREKTQLCLTNEGVFKEARNTLRMWIKNNPDCKVFSVAQNDWPNYCTCPDCKALDERHGSHAASVIAFVNRLAEDIREDYPDVLLHTFAYQYTKRAPHDMTVADNVIVRLCNIECSWDTPMEKQAQERPDSQAAGFVENIFDWGKICKHLYIWDYACNFRNYLLPFPNYRTMPENLRTYKKNHIVGVMQQGNFSYGEAAGLSDLEIYLGARLLWNPNQDENEIINEFICGVYGEECYPFIREYVDLLCDAVKGHPLTLYQNTDAGYITDSLVEKADSLFAQALAAVKTEKSRKYLQKEYLSVLFMKATRMPLENPERNALLDRLYNGVKEFRISEIRERKHLDICFENLRKSRYASANDGEYLLYYIMK
ncbi:MAG: DUF4838 domain-containing protein [Ruminococcaceae bacterium]|nr:DUF4838 domain-containing protein [Oscillospiraceae bacterium]